MLVVKVFAPTDFNKFSTFIVIVNIYRYKLISRIVRDTRRGMQYLEMFSLPISVIVNLFFHDVIYVCNLHYLLELASPRNNDSKIIPY